MYKNAIVKTPSKSISQGISHAGLGLPDYQLALKQHKNYIQALELCGLQVTVLGADDGFPDSCFVEDPAVVTPSCTIITNPGALSRSGETVAIHAALKKHPRPVYRITAPGTLDGGDVMMVGDHYYIGLSARTSAEGADQFIGFLQQHQLTGSVVELKEVLHLKTGVSYLENNVLLVSGEFVGKPEFADFERIEVPIDEAYAANCVWVNDAVIMPAGFPKTFKQLSTHGFRVVTVDVTEFEKLDGGLSCLSLRF